MLDLSHHILLCELTVSMKHTQVQIKMQETFPANLLVPISI